MLEAALAQLGERQTEDLKAPCSIHGGGKVLDFLNDTTKTILIFLEHANCDDNCILLESIVEKKVESWHFSWIYFV